MASPVSKKKLPAYEVEARQIEQTARERAAEVRLAGQAQLPRARTVGKLYDMLGIEVVSGDRQESKRRAALEARVEELIELERQVRPEGPARVAAPEQVAVQVEAAEPVEPAAQPARAQSQPRQQVSPEVPGARPAEA